jgi:CubicO group peptidase (beta-lactamase class C family)
MKDEIDIIISEAIEKKVFPGCAIASIKNTTKEIFVYGKYTYDIDSDDIRMNSVFDIASITKAIPVSCLALLLIQEGVLQQNDNLISYVPEFTGEYRDKITVHHLLTQTLHFGFRLSDCKSLSKEEILKRILEADMLSVPGSAFNYANATSILLGMVVERCTGKDLESLAWNYFFKPLSMYSTSFYAEKFKKEMCVPTEIDSWRGRLIQGEVHDESAWALRPMIAGSAGLFSTISDLSNFLEMLVNKGTWHGKCFFKEEILAEMYTDQLTELHKNQTGLGWELNQMDSMGTLDNLNIFGKTGFTGCSMAVNPLKQSGYILLSNHLYPKRRADRSEINDVRRKIAAIILK